ncbi:MAG: serine hydrolase domain-containing protein [Bacteroidota bacterium]
MQKSILFAIILALFAFTFIACDDDDEITPTPNPTPITAKAALTSALEEVVDETEIPGFTVAIVKNGALAIQSSFGYADITSNSPYTNQTTQTIGSISKTFIGAAMVKAIEEGYFTLDTDINELLPVELVSVLFGS